MQALSCCFVAERCRFLLIENVLAFIQYPFGRKMKNVCGKYWPYNLARKIKIKFVATSFQK